MRRWPEEAPSRGAGSVAAATNPPLWVSRSHPPRDTPVTSPNRGQEALEKGAHEWGRNYYAFDVYISICVRSIMAIGSGYCRGFKNYPHSGSVFLNYSYSITYTSNMPQNHDGCNSLGRHISSRRGSHEVLFGGSCRYLLHGVASSLQVPIRGPLDRMLCGGRLEEAAMIANVALMLWIFPNLTASWEVSVRLLVKSCVVQDAHACELHLSPTGLIRSIWNLTSAPASQFAEA